MQSNDMYLINIATTTKNGGDFFSLGLSHGGDQTEYQHLSFAHESRWTQSGLSCTQWDTQCDTKSPKKLTSVEQIQLSLTVSEWRFEILKIILFQNQKYIWSSQIALFHLQ